MFQVKIFLNLSSLDIVGDMVTASVFLSSLLRKSSPNPKLFPQIMHGLVFPGIKYNILLLMLIRKFEKEVW